MKKIVFATIIFTITYFQGYSQDPKVMLSPKHNTGKSEQARDFIQDYLQQLKKSGNQIFSYSQPVLELDSVQLHLEEGITYEMPIHVPQGKSNIVIVEPDTTVNYFMPIHKILPAKKE